jgi:hypothetical protein
MREFSQFMLFPDNSMTMQPPNTKLFNMLAISTNHTTIEFEVKGFELLFIHTSTYNYFHYHLVVPVGLL